MEKHDCCSFRILRHNTSSTKEIEQMNLSFKQEKKKNQSDLGAVWFFFFFFITHHLSLFTQFSSLITLHSSLKIPQFPTPTRLAHITQLRFQPKNLKKWEPHTNPCHRTFLFFFFFFFFLTLFFLYLSPSLLFLPLSLSLLLALYCFFFFFFWCLWLPLLVLGRKESTQKQD